MSRLRWINDSGFSLIELLIAIGILSIGILAVTTSMTEGRRIASDVGQRERAHWLVSDKLIELTARGYDGATQPLEPDEVALDGAIAGEDRIGQLTRRWRSNRDPLHPDLLHLLVTVRWTIRGRPQLYSLSRTIARGQTK